MESLWQRFLVALHLRRPTLRAPGLPDGLKPMPLHITLTPPAPPPAATVTIYIIAQTKSTATLGATVRDATGAVLTDRLVTWSSNRPDIAPILSPGQVGVALLSGDAIITATCEGVTDTLTVTVGSGGTPTAPTLASITPNSAAQGASAVSLDVEGTGILSDATLVFSATGISVVDVTPATDGDSLTAHINVASGAAIGAGTVKIHSPTTGDSATLPFTITATTPSAVALPYPFNILY